MDLTKYGYRKDFNWDTRFDLKNEVDGFIISTVDLGINHNFGAGEPLYYETMIFRKKGNDIDFADLYCERYPTEDEARKGHKRAIDYIKNKLEEKDE